MPETNPEATAKQNPVVGAFNHAHAWFKLKTHDWTVLHWAAALSLVGSGIGLVDRIRGKKR